MKNKNLNPNPRVKNSHLDCSPLGSLEALEARIAPATFVVTSADDAGAGSLRQAILDANLSPSKDTITFDKTFFDGTKTITLTSGEIAITDSLTIKGLGADLVKISGNNASRIFNIDDGTTAVDKVAITGVSLINGNATGDGGAIRTLESLTLKNSVFSGNTATGSGGGLSFSGLDASLLVDKSQFLDNSATISGGGLFADTSGKGKVKITGSLFADNQATLDGGGIAVATIASNKTSIIVDKSNIVNNSTGAGGGGIAFFGEAENSSLNLRNSTISNNTSISYGGGIFLNGGSSPQLSKISLDKLTISNNTSAAAALAGGGLFATGSADDIFTIKKSSFMNNKATDVTGFGGGIALHGGLAPKILGVNIVGNQASAGGGGIASDVDNLTIQGSSIVGNSVTAATGDGGGLYSSEANATISLTKTTFSANQAADDGGGIYMIGAETTLNLKTSTFTSNKALGADGQGAGVFVGPATTLAMLGGKFEANSATDAGGGLYADANTKSLNIKGTVFSGNFAVRGGGIAALGNTGEILIQSGKFLGNTADVRGGAMLLDNAGATTVAKSLIQQNSAGSLGGGIELAGMGGKTLSANKILSNTAGIMGGGIYVGVGGALTLENGVITSNVAGVEGGGVYNANATPITPNKTKIFGNAAPTNSNIAG